MNLLNQILALVFSLFGFLFGLILSFLAPEELRPGRKYFLFLTVFLSLAALTAFLFSLFSPQLFLLLPSSIFLLGLPAGTLFRLHLIKKQEEKYKSLS